MVFFYNRPAKRLFFQSEAYDHNKSHMKWMAAVFSFFPSNQPLFFVTIFLPRQAWSFVSHLPVIEVKMSVKGWWEKSQEQMERPLPVAGASLREESRWLDVHADQEYVLQVSLRRINLGQQRVSMFTFCEGTLETWYSGVLKFVSLIYFCINIT